MDDGITLILINCKGVSRDISPELKALLHYISGEQEASTDLTRSIDEAVERLNRDKEWRRWAVTFEMKLEESRDDGILYAISKFVSMLCDLGIDFEQAISMCAERFDVDEEEIEEELKLVSYSYE
ncbi:MAG: hypothetical protein IJ225_05950 [Solobacterium sp.]|nr:hypothetical protein [Solobacterium sp.]